ncbi:hypothetical protein [Thermosporothrix hazakensis]|nr:hypothetical protein [Thermosporothrix hazakensis]
MHGELGACCLLLEPAQTVLGANQLAHVLDAVCQRHAGYDQSFD